MQRARSSRDLRPVTPGTPDSAHILLGAAGYVAHERRQQTTTQQQQPKRLMNCFRDRTVTSSTSASGGQYNRTHSSTSTAQLLRIESLASSSNHVDQCGRPEAVVLLRELRTKPNKLTLLKSSSSKDLTRLLLEESTVLVSNTSLDQCSSSSNNSTNASASANAKCCPTCAKRWQNLKQRMYTLEQDLQAQTIHSQELEQKVNELTRQLTELRAQPPPPQPIQTQGKRPAVGGPVRPSRLVAWMNLSNWWKSRPSVETLREQRIFFDENCFNTELELVLKHEQHRTVPRIIIDCCDLIETKYRQSTQPVEGIYRQCGDYNRIQTLRFNIDANDYDALRQPDVDIHTLTGVLKLFLREIKSPLVSVNEAKTFIGPPNQWLLTELHQKLDTLKRLIRSLPEINRDTMDYLFAHFNRLTKVPLQQISAETLSLSITPTIFHTVPQGVHMNDIQALLLEGEMLADCVKLMIEYQGRIFE
ncbi:rho GTPase-activating protein 9 isoform X2 [Drosophila grimshawi]|nr:rho GTPase-activating protein 9 isoform X2 [Drosophila grimshawi]